MMADTTLKQQRKRAAKPMLWIGIASMVMAFVGLTSGYIVSRSYLMEENGWLLFEMPTQFIYSTVVILISSGAMVMAVRSARNGEKGKLTLSLAAALVLGIVFAVLQYSGWGVLMSEGIYFVGNQAGSWFYVLTAFHLLHLFGGWVALLVTFIKAQLGKYTEEDHQGVEMAAIFWHFVDILWICLFLFLAIIR